MALDGQNKMMRRSSQKNRVSTSISKAAYIIKQIHTFASNIIVLATTFRSGLPQPLSSEKCWGNPDRNVVAKTIMLLVNVWICLMIMISQQEPSLIQDLQPISFARHTRMPRPMVEYVHAQLNLLLAPTHRKKEDASFKSTCFFRALLNAEAFSVNVIIFRRTLPFNSSSA